jgi:membrane-associated protein
MLQRMVLDLMTVVGPLMASPVLYPMLTGLSSLDGVLPMIPSEAAVLAAGVFAHAGTPNIWMVLAATTLGVFAGDHLAYGLSRTVFGPRLIGRSRHVSQAVAAASRQLDRRAGLLIVTSRFLPGGRVTMNAACGTVRLPLSRFSPASAIAALAWAAYIAGIGFLGGTAFVENPLLGLAVGLGLSFGLGAIVELVRRRVTRRTRRSDGWAGPGRPAAPPSGAAESRCTDVGSYRSVTAIPTMAGRRMCRSRANQLPSRDVRYLRASSRRAACVPAGSSSRAVPLAVGAPGAVRPRMLHTVTVARLSWRIRLTFHASASDTMSSSSPLTTCQTGVATGVPLRR